MTKQNRAIEGQNDKSNRQKPKSVSGREVNDTPSFLPEMLTDGPMIEAQATRLQDERLQMVQRQNLASQIGGLHGNQHLQRLMESSGPATTLVIQRFSGDDLTQMSIQPEYADVLTDQQLEDQINDLRAYLSGFDYSDDTTVQTEENLRILEEEVSKREELRTGIPQLLSASATGIKALDMMTKYNVTMLFRGGEGSYFDASVNSMVIDSNESVEEAALTFVHEMNHARYHHEGLEGDVATLSREDYVKSRVEEEAEGAVLSIEAKMELELTPLKEITATFPQEAEYRQAYQQAINTAKAADPSLSDDDLKTLGRAAGKARVIHGFMIGEVVTSTTDESYPDFYGTEWDEYHNPTP